MPSGYIVSLSKGRRIQRIGSKASSLRFLASRGFATPVTHVCTWDAYERYAEGDARIIDDLRTELAPAIDDQKRYAVRSSANLEDGPSLSFAGQFTSVLDVQGVDDILKAVQHIWDSTKSSSVQTYLEQRGSGVQGLKMAVIIQKMVPAEVSGVAFSKNPYTGLDEVLVEAVRGSGEILVQDGVTPERWVNKWGTWTSKPPDFDDGRAIPFGLIEDVVRQAKEIAGAFGRPVDLEWVFDGRRVSWVQMREITTLDIPVFSNRLSKEVFPGVIKPLIWSVNVPLVNRAWMTMFTELIGPNDVQPESLAGRFYARAYFNMSAVGRIFELMGLPGESLELLMGIAVMGPERPTFKPSTKTYTLLPRMLRFAWDKARFSRKVDAFLPVMSREFQALARQQGQELNPRQRLAQIDALAPLVQATAYYNTVVAVLLRVYNALLKGQFGRLGLDYQRFDLTNDFEELDAFDPSSHLAQLSRIYLSMDRECRLRVSGSSYAQLPSVIGAEALHSGIEEFLERFGHLSDSSSDFSRTPWREDPDLVLKMVTEYTPPVAGARGGIRFEDIEVPVLRRPLLRFLYRRARRYHWYREAISSLYSYGYGLFRNSFLPLGHHFVRSGLMEQAEDIFYLTKDEVQGLAHVHRLVRDCSLMVKDRKDEIERMRDVVPPDVIFGDEAPAILPDEGGGLRGTPTSRGVYRGPVRVVQGIQDIGRVQEGDVLVIPYSDVGWAPLFAKAGAVIAESGGILSHSSIIAREYGIPAVVSVPGACRLVDDTPVTVDGHSGRITLQGLV